MKLSVIYDKIARKKFKKSEILDKEANIVNALQFKIEVPSLYDIARHIVGIYFFIKELIKLHLSAKSQKYFAKILLYLSKMVLFSH